MANDNMAKKPSPDSGVDIEFEASKRDHTQYAGMGPWGVIAARFDDFLEAGKEVRDLLERLAEKRGELIRKNAELKRIMGTDIIPTREKEVISLEPIVSMTEEELTKEDGVFNKDYEDPIVNSVAQFTGQILKKKEEGHQIQSQIDEVQKDIDHCDSIKSMLNEDFIDTAHQQPQVLIEAIEAFRNGDVSVFKTKAAAKLNLEAVANRAEKRAEFNKQCHTSKVFATTGRNALFSHPSVREEHISREPRDLPMPKVS